MTPYQRALHKQRYERYERMRNKQTVRALEEELADIDSRRADLEESIGDMDKIDDWTPEEVTRKEPLMTELMKLGLRGTGLRQHLKKRFKLHIV